MTLSAPASVTNGDQDSRGNLCLFAQRWYRVHEGGGGGGGEGRAYPNAQGALKDDAGVISINGNSIYRSERLTATFPQIFATLTKPH